MRFSQLLSKVAAFGLVVLYIGLTSIRDDVALLAAETLITAESFGEQLNPTGEPIGGGPGYKDIKSQADTDFVVSTKGELIDALVKAQAGTIVYIRDDAVIDMTGADDQAIPGGVTLASGRGRDGSLGALVFSNNLTDGAKFIPLLRTGGRDVRITGLRLRGPFAEVGDHHYDQIASMGGL